MSSRRKNFFADLLVVLIGIASFVCTPPPVDASHHDVRFKRYSLEQGLSQGNVYCMTQDRRGFLWIGTQDGLNRFDGNRFVVFNHDPFDSTSLSHNRITCLHADRDGNVWVGTYQGLNLLEPGQTTFRRFLHDPSVPGGLGHMEIHCLLRDKQGMLWLGTRNGLDRLDPETGQTEHFIHLPDDGTSLSHNLIKELFEDSSGNLWVGTLRGLNRFDSQTGSWESYYPDGIENEDRSNNQIHSIAEIGDGEFLLGTGTGLYRFNSKSGLIIRVPLLNETGNSIGNIAIFKIVIDRNRRIWLATFDLGVWLFHNDSDQVHRLQNNPLNPQSLSDNSILCLFQDRCEVIWAGTNGYGLNAWSPYLQKFERYVHDPVDSNSPSFKSFRSIYEDPAGTVWMAGYGGFNRFDPATGRFTKLPAGDLGTIRVIQGDPDSPGGILWLGTEGRGLIRYDVATGMKLTYPQSAPEQNGLVGSFIYSICPDQAGRLWIGTNKGVNRFDRVSQEFSLFHPFEDPTDSHIVLIDRVGTLWVGSSGGLARLDKDTGGFIRYRHDPADPASLSSNYVLSIYRDHSGDVWVGTNGGGLNRFVPGEERFVRYLRSAGLPNNVVYGILEDDAGRLWLSTNAGLSQFDPESETFRNYTMADNLQSLEFNASAYHRGRSGNLYFGGVNGFNIIQPDRMPNDPHPPPVVFTDLQLFNKSVAPAANGDGRRILSKVITETDYLNLSFRDRVISFELAALNFSDPARNSYAYKLEGLDTEWNEIGNRRFITFTELKPGVYRLRVRAANADGVWNEPGTSISFQISPPYWMSWWFRAIGLFMLAAALLGLHFRRLRNIEKRNTELNKSMEFLDSIINGINDPVFVKDEQHRWVAMNDTCCDLIGLPRDHLIGKSDYDVFSQQKADWFWKKDDEVLAKGRSITSETVIELQGVQHIISTKKSVFTERTSGKRFIAGTIRDITESKRAEQAIRDNEARLQSIFRASPAGIVLVVNGLFKEVNERFCELLGYRPEELLDQNIRMLFHDDTEFNEASRFISEQTSRSGKGSMEVRLRNKSRRLLDCIISTSPIDGHNPEAGWIFAALDISERKKMEHALRLTSFAVDRGANIGIWITEEGKIVYVNDTASRSLGYTHEELLKKSIFDIDGNAEEMKKQWPSLWQNLKERGSFRLETLAVTKTGGMFPIEVVYNYIEFEGKAYNCAFGTDISERKQAYEELREQQQKYSTILENIKIGVALISPDMELLEMNEQMRAWFPDIKTADLPICYQSYKKPPQQEVCSHCPVIKTLNDGAVHESISETNRDDEITHFRIVSSPIKDSDGNIVAAIQLVEDITERQRLEEHLRQAQKMEAIGTLAGGIAHDFNNILYAQMGYAKLAKKELSENSKSYEFLGMIETAGRRATDLVKQILAFSRQGGEGRQPIRLPVIMNEVSGLLRGSLPATVKIKSHIDLSCREVLAEPTQIHQILMNLCTNAFQAMTQRRGTIEIMLSEVQVNEAMAAPIQGLEPGLYARMTVQDDGSGMDKATIKQIFMPYFTTKPAGEGTGLGLSTAHGIVKSCGGAIHVESEPDKGSTFDVYFPIVQEKCGDTTVNFEGTELDKVSAHVMFVDDEVMITQMCETALINAGFEVTAHTDSPAAVREFETNPAKFDIVITDVTMPEMTGIELAKAVRMIRQDIPIIMCTGYRESIDMKWAKVFGIQEFIWKPVSLENLVNQVRQVLKRERTVEV